MEARDEEGEKDDGPEKAGETPVAAGSGPEANRGLRPPRPAAASAMSVDGAETGRHWQLRCSTTDMLTEGHLEHKMMFHKIVVSLHLKDLIIYMCKYEVLYVLPNFPFMLIGGASVLRHVAS